jgi:hypothetical protein
MSNGFAFRPIKTRLGVVLVLAAVVLVWLPSLVRAQSSSGQSGSGQSSGQSDKDSKASGQGDKSGSSDKGTTPNAQSGSNSDGQPDAKTDRDTKSDSSEGYTKLKIVITAGDSNKPQGNASVYVRYDEAPSGLLHKTKQAELNFKSNQDGTVKVPSVPRGKVLIQVVAPGWHTFGEWYDMSKDEQTVEIHLAKPPRWY